MSCYDFYAERNVSFAGKALNLKFARLIENTIRKHTSVGDNIVELGAGEGRLAGRLAKDYRYTAYEPNVKLAKRLSENGITVRNQEVPPLAEESQSIHMVVALNMIEHLTNYRKVHEVFEEIRRILVPGGFFLVESPDFNDWGAMFFDSDVTHSFITTPNRVVQLAMDLAFIPVEKKYLYGVWGTFPGLPLNVFFKFIFFVLNIVVHNWMFERKRVGKIEHMFARNFMIVFRKGYGTDLQRKKANVAEAH